MIQGDLFSMTYDECAPKCVRDLTVIQGDALERLRELPSESVQCCVTSPPYWNLRDYRVEGQIGLESTPEGYVTNLAEVFHELRRVLKNDGILWLVIGDSYFGSWGNYSGENRGKGGGQRPIINGSYVPNPAYDGLEKMRPAASLKHPVLKPKDLCGIPWRLAFALQAKGWYLRSDIVWSKPNPMPSSVTDRPTTAHEFIFLLTKNKRYYYDAEAIRNPPSADLLKQIAEGYSGNSTKSFNEAKAQDASATKSRIINGMRGRIDKKRGRSSDQWYNLSKEEQQICGSNKRSVWTVATKSYKGAHFATFPPDLIRPCILAGTRIGDTVIDPFGGSGTTGGVALELGRKAILIELNPDYIPLIEKRMSSL